MYYEIVSPIYAHEITRFRTDSERSLRGYRSRRALRLGIAPLESFMMLSVMLTVGKFIITSAFI